MSVKMLDELVVGPQIIISDQRAYVSGNFKAQISSVSYILASIPTVIAIRNGQPAAWESPQHQNQVLLDLAQHHSRAREAVPTEEDSD